MDNLSRCRTHSPRTAATCCLVALLSGLAGYACASSPPPPLLPTSQPAASVGGVDDRSPIGFSLTKFIHDLGVVQSELRSLRAALTTLAVSDRSEGEIPQKDITEVTNLLSSLDNDTQAIEHIPREVQYYGLREQYYPGSREAKVAGRSYAEPEVLYASSETGFDADLRGTLGRRSGYVLDLNQAVTATRQRFARDVFCYEESRMPQSGRTFKEDRRVLKEAICAGDSRGIRDGAQLVRADCDWLLCAGSRLFARLASATCEFLDLQRAFRASLITGYSDVTNFGSLTHAGIDAGKWWPQRSTRAEGGPGVFAQLEGLWYSRAGFGGTGATAAVSEALTLAWQGGFPYGPERATPAGPACKIEPIHWLWQAGVTYQFANAVLPGGATSAYLRYHDPPSRFETAVVFSNGPRVGSLLEFRVGYSALRF